MTADRVADRLKTILLVDDHPLFGEAIRAVFYRLGFDVTVDHATTLSAAWHRLEENAFDLVLLDLTLPDSSALEGLSRMRSAYQKQDIVVISAVENADIIDRSIALGARGFIPKSIEFSDMRRALDAILEGEIWVPSRSRAVVRPGGLPALTPTQSRILIGLLDGKLNKQIAFEIGVTEATVKGHLTEIFRRLGVRNRTQAVIAAQSL